MNAGQDYDSIPTWVRKDVAIEIMAEMLADKTREILEARKPPVDYGKLKKLEQERDDLLGERKKMYFGDEVVIKKIILEYGEIVRNQYTGDQHE